MASNTVCTVCKKQEVDSSKLISCQYCFKSVHLACRNMSSKNANRVTSNSCFCSAQCSLHFKRILEQRDPKLSIVASVTSEIRAAVSVELTSMRDDIKTLTTAIESSQEFLSSKFDDIINDLVKLKNENDVLKKELEILKLSHTSLKSTVNKLEMHVDNANREQNQNNLVFLGLPSLPNENVYGLISETSKAIGVELNSEDVISAVRFGVKKSNTSIPPVKVVFQRNCIKELIQEKKRKLGTLLSSKINENLLINRKPTVVSVRDELTPLSLQILRYLRARQQQLGLKYVWTGRGGSVLVKKQEGSRVETIKNFDDMNRLVHHCQLKKT